MPVFLRQRWIGFLTICSLLGVVGGWSLPVLAAPTPALSVAGIVAAANHARTANGVQAIALSATLSTAAQAKAEAMAAAGDFAHTLSSGVTPWSFITNAGYCYKAAAENLAVHYTSDRAVVAGWMNSPTHRANLLGAQFEEVGVGIAQAEVQGHAGYLVVQLLGTELAPVYYPYVAHCSA